MSNDDIVVRKRRSWSSVPDDVLEDLRLNPRSRLLLAWMLGRPNDWKIQVGHMLKVLGVSEYEWRSSRAELQRHGYYLQLRVRQANGSFAWKKEVFDPPVPPSSRNSGMAETIRDSVGDGELAHESVMHEFLGDIPPPSKHDQLPPPPTSSRKRRASLLISQPVVADLDDLIEAAYWQAMKADKLITNPSAWRASVRKRIQENGPSAEDQLCLEEWRASLKTKERRQAEAAEKAAKIEPVADMDAARERLRNLVRPFVKVGGSSTLLDKGETTANQPQDDGETPS
jgi:hypothetical protein